MERFEMDGLVAGCDEAGRGCLAGPVVAASVILPKDFHHPDLNDSKVLSEKKRINLRQVIEREAITFGVGFLTPEEIDQHNILKGSFMAMHRALFSMEKPPDCIIVDGNRFLSYQNIPHHCIIKGDGKYFSIAAASVLAKTYRDDYMKTIDADYPMYGWTQNKGYPTKAHRKAIVDHGPSPHHRMSFRLYPQLELF